VTDRAARDVRRIHASAPIRVNDLGGWTDTWFAEDGAVVNFAVRPAVEVQIDVRPNTRRLRRRVTVRAENFGDVFAMDPSAPRMDVHPLLQHTIASAGVPKAAALDIRISSPVPPGISTGTSASVCVALLGALDALTSGRRGAREIARLAHRVETERLGLQSGVQDQIAAASGGITLIRMRKYPDSQAGPVRVPGRTWDELDRRLCLVYLGRPHRSTAMHERVIAALEAGGPQKATLAGLSRIAGEAHRALLSGDLVSLGECMVRNNEKQRALSPELVSASADAVSTVARRFGAAGWKVNGAGGRGGSMAVLAAEDDGLRRRMVAAIESLGKGIAVIPISLSPRGLSVWSV
jgi:D-glycero-alpha-D-manno-heptose-7-phosphate kinase